MLVIAADVVQAPNDKQQIEPMLKIESVGYRTHWGKAERLLADTGYFQCGETSPRGESGRGSLRLIRHGAGSRIIHRWAKFFCDDPLAPENPTPVWEAMAHRLKTRAGR